MAKLFKKKEPEPMLNMIGGLLLCKSLILLEYVDCTEKRRNVIIAKNIISKVSPEVYHFCKYCMNNPTEAKIERDEIPFLNNKKNYEYEIKHNKEDPYCTKTYGFRVNTFNDEVEFYVDYSWELFSISKMDKALLFSVFHCLNEREVNSNKLEKIQRTISTRTQYLRTYKETS